MSARTTLRWLLAISVVGLIVVSAAGFILIRDQKSEGEPAQADSLHPSEMTPAALYQAVGEMLASRPDILHLTATTTSQGFYDFTLEKETWLLGDPALVRHHLQMDDPLVTDSSIITEVEEFSVAKPQQEAPRSSIKSSRQWQCYDAPITAGFLLGCYFGSSSLEQYVEEGRYQGKQVVVLNTTAIGPSDAGQRTSVVRLYLDADTLLPLESLVVETAEAIQEPRRLTTSYDLVEWLPLASVPADLFQPATIGWLETDPEDALREVNDLQRYWLGREFVTGSSEPLVLRIGYVAPNRGVPYRYSLTYALKSTPHDPPFLTLQVFHRDMWEQSPAIPEMAVTLGDTVVFISESQLPGRERILDRPGMLDAIKQGLLLYQSSP